MVKEVRHDLSQQDADKVILSTGSWNKLTGHEPEGELEAFLGSFVETEWRPGRLQHPAAHIVIPLKRTHFKHPTFQ